jgi:hypothetical protein
MESIELLLSKLERNVERELETQVGIQALLDQQLEILLKGRSEKLAAVLANAEEGLAKSRVLEQERGELIGGFADALGVARGQVSLALLAERLGAQAASLGAKGAALKAQLERIRETNRRVALLLRHSVLFLDDLVRVVTGGASGAPTYTREGTLQSRAVGTVAARA